MTLKRFFYLLFFIAPGSSAAQNRYDVVIDEIMVDPSPQVGLPANEWIELKNTSAVALNLQLWRIGDAGGLSGPMPNYILQPDSFVIVCPASAVTTMSVFGPVISVTGFPSLDNDGEMLFLRAASGKTIHAINYTSGWYQNEIKKEGGWTLEMTDTESPCAGISNWKASTHVAGGTPGKKNSLDAINNDVASPKLLSSYSIDSLNIRLVYDEPIDSMSGATLANYSITGGLSFITASTISPLFNQVQLKTSGPLLPNTVYNITAGNVKDCSNNLISLSDKVRTGLAVDAFARELVINEILFNPRSNGFDYIEFYNNSSKIFNAEKLYIANRNSSGTISSIKPLSSSPHYFFPGDHIVVTEDPLNLALHYHIKEPANVIAVVSPPSFPDDVGTVIVLNFQGTIVDEVHYKDDWHFKLIDNPEGVALERIDPSSDSQDPGNWHSAASTAGYGTPGYRNSQYRQSTDIQASVQVNPYIFSPDNDGRDDFATIQYELSEPGYVANITLFDVAGRPVRNLVRNGTLALKGNWNWDGLDDKGAGLPVGIYIILTEILDLSGRKERFKNTLVLARPLK